MAGVRDVGAGLQRPVLRPPLRAAARAEPPVPQSRQARRRPVPHLAEHGGQLRHEHELAVLRRRVHHVVPHPDGGARGAELRLRRCRDGRSRRGRTRDRTPLARGDRQLLAGPLPLLRLHPVAAHGRPRGDPHLTGRRPDLPRARDRDDPRGCAADDRTRPRRVADRDQAARHERRRVLQLELRGAVREPERPDELPRDAGDPADPRGPGLHVREDGPGATPRVDGLHRDVRGLRDRHRRQPAGGAARLRGSPPVGRQPHPGQRAVGREHVRQGGPVRPGGERELDGGDQRRLERVGERRASTPRRRPAARSRW